MFKCSLNQFLIKIKIITTVTYSEKNVPIKQLKNNCNRVFFDSIILLRFNKTKAAKEKFYGAKKPTKI